MANFASNGDKSTYPRSYREGQDDNSAGFVNPHKIATGNTRGTQRIKGTIEVVDDNNIVRVIIGYKKDAF